MSTATFGRVNDSQIGALLRDWRTRRRRSQLDLALDAGISTRHLSFVETGRSRPSPEMVLTLAERLEVPLRERNQLLLAAGYAPRYSIRSLDDPELSPIRGALGHVLTGHEPFPALAVDHRWNLVASNSALTLLLDGVADELLVPPVNALRVALHPDGMAPRVTNLPEWRGHLLNKLNRAIKLTGDEWLIELERELLGYPGGRDPSEERDRARDVMVGLRLATAGGTELSFISTITTFGTPLDITVSELGIEAFYPADAATGAALVAAAATATATAVA
jgi:transcriptional regulator with XRE-family HTH domain